ncbi:LysR family transcriptional regulator [Rhodovarius lipocyclicus]|uniref:LysR family transcriptional regulator n=1 Tax=Rhodovarius lipocyclicus TaxID=268410 RepID=UPI001358A54A|nr:LysR family transcriptional regulator [Rhodovarius lipocyclicus]
MELDWLKDFLALAEQRNFSRAAELRHVTQPAFSRRIRALEDWIGTPLFQRGAQGAELTPAGAHFHPLAEELLHRLHHARRDTKAVAEREAASLSIAATHALSFTFFPGWIRARLPLEALGAINLVSDSLEACEQIMLAGEVHALLCHHHPDAPGRLDAGRFESRRVGGDVLVPMCAPGSAWTLEGPTRLLGYGQASGLGRILAAAAPALPGPVEVVFTSHLAATLMTMAREGYGVAWLPLTMAGEEMERGRLVRAGGEGFDIPVEIRLFRALGGSNPGADLLWAMGGE